MNESVVYFADRAAESGYSMLDKLEHIFNRLGLADDIKPGEKVMIKTHFGQFGNTNYIRPAYVRKIADLVKKAGGIPFAAETCGLGYGTTGVFSGRTTAPDYLGMAAQNGFSEATIGCPIIMADGYWGVDTFDVPIDGEFIDRVDVAAAVLDCDKVVMLTHAKGHGLSGLGGTLKNLGIGLVGKRGKAAMHNLGDFEIDPEKCLGPECSKCLKVCPTRCITMQDIAQIDDGLCVNCAHCRSVCNNVGAKAISVTWRNADDQPLRFVENALGVLDSIGRDRFYHINLAIDISDLCDCWGVGAPLLVHDIGILGSHDPLAVDQATQDKINEAPANPDSLVGDLECGECKFAHALSARSTNVDEPVDRAEIQFAHAEKMGLGSRKYSLVQLNKDDFKKK